MTMGQSIKQSFEEVAEQFGLDTESYEEALDGKLTVQYTHHFTHAAWELCQAFRTALQSSAQEGERPTPRCEKVHHDHMPLDPERGYWAMYDLAERLERELSGKIARIEELMQALKSAKNFERSVQIAIDEKGVYIP